MTAINKLTNKETPIGSDLIPIWDSQASRTRNITVQAMSDYTASDVNPVTDISYSAPNLVVTFADGSTKNVDIS